MLKKILYGLLGLVVLLVIVGFLMPGKIEVSRSATINAPAEYAYEEIANLESWPNWSYWNTLDTTMQLTYGDKRSGQGASYTWTSKDMGDGKITLAEAVPYSSITADLDFMENGTAKGGYTFEPEGDATKVTMSFSSDMGMNPVKRLFGTLVMKSEIEHAFDYGLEKIKASAEAKPKFTVKITEETVSPISYIGLAHTMNPQDSKAVEAQMGKMYSELSTVLSKAKAQQAGKAFCLFPSYSDTTMEMVCALPVDSNAKLPAKYRIQQTPGGKTVKVVHTGPYDGLETAHEQINKYVQFKKLQIAGAPWEVYVVDPMAEKDPAKYVTEIYYPVK